MKVLVAIDGSNYSEAAVQRIIEQVRREGTEVRVLHVIEPVRAYLSVTARERSRFGWYGLPGG